MRRDQEDIVYYPVSIFLEEGARKAMQEGLIDQAVEEGYGENEC